MPNFSTRFVEEWSPFIFNWLVKSVALWVADGNAFFQFSSDVYFNKDPCIGDLYFICCTFISSDCLPQETFNFPNTTFSPIH